MPEKSISFRSELQSNVTDLLSKAGLHCVRTNRLVTSLVSAIAAYTEEGVALSPTIYLASSAEKLARVTGGTGHIELGAGKPLASSGAEILKVAAPLAGNLWHIYIETNAGDGTCSFGVICGSADPSALSLDETLLAEFDPDFPIVQVDQISKNKVSVRTSHSDAVQFRFNDDEDEDDASDSHHMRLISQAMAADNVIKSDVIEDFYYRQLRIALSKCHGSLVAVLPAGQDNLGNYIHA